jgi:hypothetical protein
LKLNEREKKTIETRAKHTIKAREKAEMLIEIKDLPSKREKQEDKHSHRFKEG